MSSNNVKILNVFGEEIKPCCFNPLTGYFRDGFCRTAKSDYGTHIICCQVNTKFLNFSKAKGNDLITPVPEYQFPGLLNRDFWCLCILRWIEAFKEDCAPKVKLQSTNQEVLNYVDLETLKKYSIDIN